MTASAQFVAVEPKRKSAIRVIGASLAGTSLEWYDHAIYGSAAALVFPKVFFPQSDPLTATLLSMTTYAVGFLSRPLGGLICGYFGDRFGRKNVLIMTLVLMGSATFLVGLLPTYQSIGVSAAIILSILRVLQGIALGGEWGGASLMVNEIDPEGRRRGFYGSMVQVGSPVGYLLAYGMFALVTFSVAPDAFLSWGWRIPFLASGVLILIGYYIRRSIAESPLFEEIERRQQTAKAPITEVVRLHWRSVLIAIGSRIGSDIVFFVFSVFLLIYLRLRLGMDVSTLGFAALLCASLAQLIGIPLFGYLSDSLGRRPILIFGGVGCIIWSLVFFPLLATKQTSLIVTATFIGMFLHAAMWGPLSSYMPEMFPTRVRYTGASLGFQGASVFGGALAPIITTWLLGLSPSPWPIQVYVILFLLLLVYCVYLASETAHKDLQ
jgi:metabolite-proton symporter